MTLGDLVGFRRIRPAVRAGQCKAETYHVDCDSESRCSSEDEEDNLQLITSWPVSRDRQGDRHVAHLEGDLSSLVQLDQPPIHRQRRRARRQAKNEMRVCVRRLESIDPLGNIVSDLSHQSYPRQPFGRTHIVADLLLGVPDSQSHLVCASICIRSRGSVCSVR